MTRLRLDHVAVETTQLEADIELLCSELEFQLIRRGTHTVRSTPIALLRTEAGIKVELIQVDAIDAAVTTHLAFRCADRRQLRAAADRLAPGFPTAITRISAAAADSAFVTTSGGLRLQLIVYDADSPDRETETL